ncbi:MAG: hypothetical protein ACMUHU_06365, partial [Thermoplasmatota archaeon]
DPMERIKDQIFLEKGIRTGREKLKATRKMEEDALEYLELLDLPEDLRDRSREAAVFHMAAQLEEVPCRFVPYHAGHTQRDIRRLMVFEG